MSGKSRRETNDEDIEVDVLNELMILFDLLKYLDDQVLMVIHVLFSHQSKMILIVSV